MPTFIFLAITFTTSWTVWILMNAYGLYGSMLYMAVSAMLMFTPLLATLATHIIFKTPIMSLSFRPKLRGNIGKYLIAWLSPCILSILGALVYFLIWRDHFQVFLLEEALLSTPFTIQTYSILMFIAALFGAFINMFFALGEEIGWRGFLYPRLSSRIGKTKAYILTGIIWGLWHTPINIMGYNYGIGYPGYPVSGIIAMCLFCTIIGAWLSYLSDSCNSIWPAALFHGGVNASGSFGIMFLSPDTPYILGPALSGIIPSLIAGVVLLLLKKEKTHA